MTSISTQFQKLGYRGNLRTVSAEASSFYGTGQVNNIRYLDEGYEDYNLKLDTNTGKYVLKLFANNQLGDYSKTRRGSEVVERLVEILEETRIMNLNTPRLRKANDGEIIFRSENNIIGIMYGWIEGATFYELDAIPTRKELEAIIEQAVKINSINIKPIYYHDIWAVNHIHELYKKVEGHINQSDRELLSEIFIRFDKIPFNRLPKCFVHGDFTKGNIIRTPSGKPYLIDFSVSNWTTRIIEPGLIASNLMFDNVNKTSLKKRVVETAFIYKKYGFLSKLEEKYLFDIALANTAMEFLGSLWRQKYLNDTSKETGYWLNLGREGMKEALSE